MRHPGVVIALIAGSGLDGHADRGDGAVVLQGGDGQAIGQGGDLQGLSLDQLPLCLSHSRLSSKLSFGSCLKGMNSLYHHSHLHKFLILPELEVT